MDRIPRTQDSGLKTPAALRGRSGQASMEFLTTYGWAVLIILVVLVAVWQMGLFDFSSRLAPGYSGFSVLVPMDWGMTSSGGACTLNAYMANGAGQWINSARTLDGDYCIPAAVAPGNYTRCWMPVSPCPGPGGAYEEDITVTYQRSSDNQSFRTAGRLWGNAE